MQFYKVTGLGSGISNSYECTHKEAHEKAKVVNDFDLPETRVELVEIDTDKKTLASILSGWGCTENVLRTWKLTSRRGLTECENGE